MSRSTRRPLLPLLPLLATLLCPAAALLCPAVALGLEDGAASKREITEETPRLYAEATPSNDEAPSDPPRTGAPALAPQRPSEEARDAPRDPFGPKTRRFSGDDSSDDRPTGDGVYGRFDGDFSGSIGVGAEFDTGATVGRVAIQGALRFYQAIGIAAGYSQAVDGADPLERAVTVGLLVEPLFLLRWSNDAEFGRPTADLLLDSLSLSLGAALLEPRGGSFGERAAFDVGLGAGLPLLGRAAGPWLRARGTLRLGDEDPTGILQLFFEWQGFLESSLIGD